VEREREREREERRERWAIMGGIYLSVRGGESGERNS